MRLRALAAGCVLLFGGVAAFGTVPDEPPPVGQTIVQPLAIPFPTTAQPANEVFWREERFERGDTFASFLTRLGVRSEDAAALVRQASTSKTFRMLTPGASVQARTTSAGDLLSLEFVSGRDTLVGFERSGNQFSSIEEQVPLTRVVKMSAGEIKSSLFAATDDAGLPDAISSQIAEIFSGDVDFHRDLRRGDRFAVVYEMLYYEGRAVKAGRVLAAEFVNDGRAYRAVWFEQQEGRGGYYTPEGKNLRKAFLRSPLEFSRVTSGFSMRRHPILQDWRRHKGVDYGAPSGTRVRATADGAVDFAGRQGGYGNVLILRHAGNVTTLYAHLNGFASGVRKGARVSQGDVVGYVGATGWATGPHLHYEFRVGSEHRNPLTVAMPAADPIPATRMHSFRLQAQNLAAHLQLMSGVALVSLE